MPLGASTFGKSIYADQMKVVRLYYARAAADLGSFSRAATALSVTRPASSHGIAALGRTLGGTLLDRTTTGVTPTALVERVLPLLRAALGSSDSLLLESRFATSADPEPPQLGISPVIHPDLVARAFHTAAPNWERPRRPPTYRGFRSAMSSALTDLQRASGSSSWSAPRPMGLHPTAAGHRLLPQIRTLLVAAGELQGSARDLGDALIGLLVIGCHVPIAPYLLPRLLLDFGTRHPEVELEFIEDSNPDLENLLFDGRCEVTITCDLLIRPPVVRELLYTAHHHVLLPGGDRPTRTRCHSPSWPRNRYCSWTFPGRADVPRDPRGGRGHPERLIQNRHLRIRPRARREDLAHTLVAHRIHIRAPWGPEVTS